MQASWEAVEELKHNARNRQRMSCIFVIKAHLVLMDKYV